MLYKSRWASMVKRPRNAALLIIVVTLTMLPLQIWLSYDYLAYDSGSVQLRWYDQELGPNETVVIQNISNWHTLDDISIEVDPVGNSVILYAIDENIPDDRHLEGNYTNESPSFKLPYRYTRFPTIANWSVYLSNPSPNETLTVVLYDALFGILIDPPPLDTWLSMAILYRFPSNALTSLWVAVTLFTRVTNRQKKKEDEATTPSVVAGACIVAYLVILAPIGGWALFVGNLFYVALVCGPLALLLKSSKIDAEKMDADQEASNQQLI